MDKHWALCQGNDPNGSFPLHSRASRTASGSLLGAGMIRYHMSQKTPETAISLETYTSAHPPTVGPRRIVPIADFTARGLTSPAGGAPLPNLVNHGGPVLGAVQVVPIYWGLKWATLSTKTNITIAQELNNFFDFILSSPYMDLLAEYSTPSTKIQHGARLQSHTITNNEPGTATPTGRQVTDAQIQNALQGWIASKNRSGCNRQHASTSSSCPRVS